MKKIQFNLFLDKEIRDQFDRLADANHMNRPSYFSMLVTREYKRLAAEKRNQGNNEAVSMEPAGEWSQEVRGG